MTSSSVFIVCIAVVCFVQSDKPSNTLTELSKPTNLICCSERGSLVWKHQQLNNDGVSDQICSGQTCHKTGYSINNSTPGCFHLIINSTSIDAAGLYQCNEDATGNVSGAYLVVYNFSCNYNFDNSDDLVEGDRVKFHCSMSWRGKWPFEIRWLDEHGIEKQKDVSLNSFDSSSLEVNVSRPNLPSYTVQFVFLNNGITDQSVDKSCPIVTWSSPIRDVKYPPSNIKLSCPDERCERRIDETINCSADGFPIPEFHWLDWDDKRIASGSVLELKSLDTHSYRCVATNIIRGKNYETSKTIVVNVKSKPDIAGSQCAETNSCNDKITTLIIIVIVIIVILIVIIVGVFVWCLIRKIWVKKHASSQQMVSPPEQIIPPPQEEVPLLIKEIKAEAEGDKPSLPPGEQKDPNVRINHKEYNNGLRSANSMIELGIVITPGSGEVCQASETSEDEGSGVQRHPTRRHAHPEPEVASLITQGSVAETEDESTF